MVELAYFILARFYNWSIDMKLQLFNINQHLWKDREKDWRRVIWSFEEKRARGRRGATCRGLSGRDSAGTDRIGGQHGNFTSPGDVWDPSVNRALECVQDGTCACACATCVRHSFQPPTPPLSRAADKKASNLNCECHLHDQWASHESKESVRSWIRFIWNDENLNLLVN